MITMLLSKTGFLRHVAQKLGMKFHWISKITHWVILPPVRTISGKYQKDT